MKVKSLKWWQFKLLKLAIILKLTNVDQSGFRIQIHDDDWNWQMLFNEEYSKLKLVTVQIVQIGNIVQIDECCSNWRHCWNWWMLFKLANEEWRLKLFKLRMLLKLLKLLVVVEIVDGCWWKIVGKWGFKIQIGEDPNCWN